MSKSGIYFASSAKRPAPSDRKHAIDTFISCGWITVRENSILVEIVNHCIEQRISYSWFFQSGSEGEFVTVRRVDSKGTS